MPNKIVWSPAPNAIDVSQMGSFMRFINKRHGKSFADYPSLYAWSIHNVVDFWKSLSDWSGVSYVKPPGCILRLGKRMQDSRWFQGATLNFAQNLLSRKDTHTAISFTAESGENVVVSYAELFQQVAALVAYLREQKLGVGERVCAMVPNFHLSIVCMLAVTAVGAIWCSASPDFGVDALTERFAQVEPSVLFAVDGHSYNGKNHAHSAKIKELCTKIPSIKLTIVLPYLGADQNDLGDAVSFDVIQEKHANASDIRFEALPFSHPVYILFSSGTTGKPKCLVHGAGGTLLQHIKEHRLHGDLRSDERIFFYTTCGWMMWNWLVSALVTGATLVLYDGSPFYPAKDRLFDLIDKEKINVFGVGAQFIEESDKFVLTPVSTHDLSSLRQILSTGSPLLPASFDYIHAAIKPGVQISSIAGGSDIISCFMLGNPLLPVYRGELQAPGLGMDVEIFNDKGSSVIDEKGELVCLSPFPSMPVGFWGDHDGARYQSAYFERFEHAWTHGDYASINGHLGVTIYGRSDATLNPGGVRIGTAEIYQVLEKIPEISEACAVGHKSKKGERIVLFVVLKSGLQLTDKLEKTIKKAIRKSLSPKHVPAVIQQVTDLPRTANGKLVELAVANSINGEDVVNVSALSNPQCLNQFRGRVSDGPERP